MNEIDEAYLRAAQEIMKVSQNHENRVFVRASIDFIASLTALSHPPVDISRIIDDLYESYLYFATAASTKPQDPSTSSGSTSITPQDSTESTSLSSG